MNKKKLIITSLIITFAFELTNSFSQSKPLFPVLKDDSITKDISRLGFINNKGKLEIEFKFYYANEFSEEMAAVILTKGGKWGYIDDKGQNTIAAQFDEAASFSNGLAKVSKNGKTFFITKDGKKAFDTSLLLLGFQEGLSPAKLSEKWGFVNKEGKIVIPFTFQSANPFYENLSAVTQNGLVGYIDKSGSWVIPPRFSLMRSYSDQLFLTNFSEGLAVYRDGDKYGFINYKGVIVISAYYDKVGMFSEGLALVELNGKIGYINKDGQYAIIPLFEDGKRFSNGLASVKLDGKWGYIDPDGNLQIPPQYDSAEPFRNGLAKVSKYDEGRGDTITGYVNKFGKLVYSWKR